VQSVNEKREELMRIVLGIAAKYMIYGTNCSLNVIWNIDRFSLAPHSFDKFGIGLR